MRQPVLRSNRILLRKYKISDAFEDYKIGRDKEVSKWIYEIPSSYKLEDAKKWIRSILKNKKDYFYAIILKDTKKLIGTTWINHIKNRTGELSYLIEKKYWERGYATKAVKIMLKFGFDNLKLNKICAKVNELNKSSIKILEKFDFKLKKILKKKARLKFTKKLYNEFYFELLKKE